MRSILSAAFAAAMASTAATGAQAQDMKIDGMRSMDMGHHGKMMSMNSKASMRKTGQSRSAMRCPCCGNAPCNCGMMGRGA
jgi:hypothetical protein